MQNHQFFMFITDDYTFTLKIRIHWFILQKYLFSFIIFQKFFSFIFLLFICLNVGAKMNVQIRQSFIKEMTIDD